MPARKVPRKLVSQLRKALRNAKVKTRPEVLLMPNVPAPMHGLAPRVVLGQKWWDETRAKAYASTQYHCVACGVHKDMAIFHRWLEGHELYAIDHAKGRMKYLETVPLRHSCHCFIHSGRLAAIYDRCEIDEDKYRTIMDHGERVLKQAGLIKEEYDGPMAPWEKWRLVIGRKTYPPIHATEADWEEYYAC